MAHDRPPRPCCANSSASLQQVASPACAAPSRRSPRHRSDAVRRAAAHRTSLKAMARKPLPPLADRATENPQPFGDVPVVAAFRRRHNDARPQRRRAWPVLRRRVSASSSRRSARPARSSRPQWPVASRLIARMAVAVAGAIASWRQSAASLRFGYGAFGPTLGVNNEPTTMDRLIPRFVTFPQATDAYTTCRQSIMRRAQQESS